LFYFLVSKLLFVAWDADKIHSKMGEGMNCCNRIPSNVEWFLFDLCACYLSSGTFGQVLECWDRERKEMVAIKIVRGIKKYREAAMIEIDVLQQLGKHDKGGSR